MITIQNQTWCFVGTNEGEIGLTNIGTWQVTYADYVAGWTNAPTYFDPPLKDGAVVLVDAAGQVFVSDGPDLLHAIDYGVAASCFSVGMFLIVRYLWRNFASSSGVPMPSDS